MANINMQEANILTNDILTGADTINILTYNQGAIYKLPITTDTIKLLTKAGLLVGGKSDGAGANAEIFNDYINNTAAGAYATAAGQGTSAKGNNNFVIGKYNIENEDALFIIGNGVNTNQRGNAHILDTNGNAWYKTDVTIGDDKISLRAMSDDLNNKNKENGYRPKVYIGRSDETLDNSIGNIGDIYCRIIE